MQSLRFLVAITCIGISTSFVRISYINNGVPGCKNLKLYESADPISIGDFIESIKGTPRRISDTTARISGTIQAAPGQISRNVKDATDAVIYFPSNVTATVTETQSNIIQSTDDVKRKVKALSPVPFINNAFKFTKSIIDTAYELKDGKIDGSRTLAKSSVPEKVKVVKAKPEKSAEESYEEAKESFYSTVDSINDFGRGVVATVERVQQIPDDITKTRESVVLTAEIFQKDIAEKQQQAQEIGKVVWKVVTLEAAKETFERTEKQYQNTVKYVSDTKTMLQTNPTAIFSGGVKAKEKETVPIIAPVPVPVPVPAPVVTPVKKEDSSLDKIWGAIKVTKAGLDATVTTAKSLSNGVKGLKKRIDKDIAKQAASASGIPLPVSSILSASAPDMVPIDDSSELTYSSSTSTLAVSITETLDEIIVVEDIVAIVPVEIVVDSPEVIMETVESIDSSSMISVITDVPSSSIISSNDIDSDSGTHHVSVTVPEDSPTSSVEIISAPLSEI